MSQLALPLPEVEPASTRCQRWTDRRHTWRDAVPGARFDPARYEVHPVGEAPAKRFVLAHHYSASYPAAVHRYGLYRAARLVGVAVFSVPVQARVLTAAFPDLAPFSESVELGRFVLADDVPGNGESWFLARCYGELRAVGVRGVVAFADPVPRRTAAGRLVVPGHVGWIYQASNAVYAGRSTARTLTVLPDGTAFPDRAASKVRAGERGHEYAERRLVALGAAVPRAGQSMSGWLAAALSDVGARRLRHGGCHRYLFALGAHRRDRERIRIGLAPDGYPKTRDDEAA